MRDNCNELVIFAYVDFYVSLVIINIFLQRLNVINLILMRHAKSDWSENVADFERVLNKRGRKNCLALRAWFMKNNIKPDVAIVSSAKRTKHTFELIFAIPEIRPGIIQYEKILYQGNREQIIQTIRNSILTYNTILVIAHNPTISEAAQSLCMPGQKENLPVFPTGTLAILSFPNSEFEYNSGELIHFISAKTLMTNNG